jgi:hypothetical protein
VTTLTRQRRRPPGRDSPDRHHPSRRTPAGRRQPPSHHHDRQRRQRTQLVSPAASSSSSTTALTTRTACFRRLSSTLRRPTATATPSRSSQAGRSTCSAARPQTPVGQPSPWRVEAGRDLRPARHEHLRGIACSSGPADSLVSPVRGSRRSPPGRMSGFPIRLDPASDRHHQAAPGQAGNPRTCGSPASDRITNTPDSRAAAMCSSGISTLRGPGRSTHTPSRPAATAARASMSSSSPT